ncbi:MAG: molybdopterin-binding protein, partial [Acidobacteriota bacterium]
ALAAGRAVTPAVLGLAASQGITTLSVHRPPTVALLVTGDEVVAPDTPTLAPGQLRDVHTPFLRAATADGDLRLPLRVLPAVADAPGALRAAIADGGRDDVLLLTGGVSRGAHDHVPDTVVACGARIVLHRISLQPGRPLLVARHAGGWIVGMPGNPASVMVTYRCFVRPLLRRLMGFADGFGHGARPAALAEDASPLPPPGPRTRMLPAQIVGSMADEATVRVRPLRPRGSHDIVAWAQADALLWCPSADDAAAGRTGLRALVDSTQIPPS